MRDRKDKNWTRRDFMVVSSAAAIGAALPLGCGGDKAASSGAGGAAVVDAAAQGTPWKDKIKSFDFIESLHLADVAHYGEFVKFGTASRFKYTMGDWMTGWGNDTTVNGVSFTWASTSPIRMYFTADTVQPLTFVFRVKAAGVKSFSVYLNDHPLKAVSMTGSGFENYAVSATAEQVKAGENYLKLMFATSSTSDNGIPTAFAVDYLRILPEDTPAPKEFVPPMPENMLQSYTADKKERTSLIVSAPMTLSWYLDVPATGHLCFSAASMVTSMGKTVPCTLEAQVTPADGSASKTVLSHQIDDDKWHEQMADISAYAGQLVRIDVSAKGPEGARIALGDPALRTTPVKLEGTDAKKKNVIVLLIDTQRADKLSSYGNRRIKTPEMEKFVSESAVFEHCQANSNWTKPSCASVFTGLHPDSHKARGHASVLSKNVKLISEIYRSQGFATGAFVANGYLADEFGFKRGWSQYINFIRENKNSDAVNVFKATMDFIKDQGDKPFFTYIQTIDPHVPYDPPEEDLKLYDAQPYDGPVRPRSTGELLEQFKRKKVVLEKRDRRRLEALYDGEVTYHDRQFGKFIEELKKAGVYDNTIFVVTADHGEEFFEHNSVGHGHSVYQELLHVPMIIRAPGLVPAGKRLQAPTTLVDILPTTLKAVGKDVPREVEGKDLLPLARGAAPHPFDAAFSSFYSEMDSRNLQWSVRRGDWKLWMKGPVNTFVHNLQQDPGEKVDVDEKYPIALRGMRIALGQFIGAPDKTNWFSNAVAGDIVAKPKAVESKNEDIPDDLKQQLRELGYLQ